MTLILRQTIAAMAAMLLLASLSYGQDEYKSETDGDASVRPHTMIRFASIPNATPDPNAPPNPACVQSSCNCPAKEVDCLPMPQACEKPVTYHYAGCTTGGCEAPSCGCGKSCGCTSGSCTSGCTAGCCAQSSCTAGCDSGCGSSCNLLGECCRGGGFVAGFQQSYLKPHFTNSPGVPQDPAGNLGNLANLNFATDPVGFDYGGASEFWIGYENCDGLGIRAKYWNFGEGGNSVTAINLPFQGVNETLEGRMDLRSADLQITERVEFCHWEFQFNEGFKYADIRDSSHLFFATAPVGTGIVVDLATSRHNFHGVGPTLGLQAVRPICDSHFSFYCDGQFSLLFGSSNFNTDFLDIRGAPQNASADRDALVPITELQIGLEWQYCLKRGGKFFVRGGMEAQAWFDAGNIASTDGDMGLYGGTFGLGLAR